MRRSLNPCCVYTGRVGAKLRPRKMTTPKRPVLRSGVYCQDGPFQGRFIRLEKNGDMRTLPILVRGHAGHYASGKWVPAEAMRAAA